MIFVTNDIQIIHETFIFVLTLFFAKLFANLINYIDPFSKFFLMLFSKV
jgi:hypothetical protein